MMKDYIRNEKLKETFDLVANDFEVVGPNYFTYFGHQLVTRSGLSRGKSVLDVACGRGASLYKAAQVIGREGSIRGVDFSSEMIRYLQCDVNEKVTGNIKLKQMDAEDLKFKAFSFDFVFCGLSTHFFSNLNLAIFEMYRVLKKEGQIGISSWSIKKDKSKKGVFDRAYARVYSKNDTRKLLTDSERFDLSSIDGFRKALEAVGFDKIDIQEESKAFIYKSKDEWWQEQTNNATRGFLERLKSISPELFKTFKEVVYEEIEKDMIDGQIIFNAKVLYGYGVK